VGVGVKSAWPGMETAYVGVESACVAVELASVVKADTVVSDRFILLL
jgi:hypothetical protein